MKSISTWVFRLVPGDDLLQGIVRVCNENNIASAAIISAVGSLSQITIRTADGITVERYIDLMEITSLSGTLSQDGVHFHISCFNKEMKAIGGHVKEGCIIHTTAEIVLLNLDTEWKLIREPDSTTGYDELVCKPIIHL